MMMSERFGIRAEIHPEQFTLYELGDMVLDLRRYGVDDESKDYSLTYKGGLDISNLLEEQMAQVILILEKRNFVITYVYAYDTDTDDIETTVYDIDEDSCTVQEALDGYLKEIPDCQTRLEDFVGDDLE